MFIKIVAYLLTMCMFVQNLTPIGSLMDSVQVTEVVETVTEISTEVESREEEASQIEDVTQIEEESQIENVTQTEEETQTEGDVQKNQGEVEAETEIVVEETTEKLSEETEYVEAENTSVEELSTYTVEELYDTLEERLLLALETYQYECYIGDLRIADTEAEAVSEFYKDFMLTNPQYFWMTERAGTRVNGGIVTYINFSYEMGYSLNGGVQISKVEEDRRAFEEVIYKILAPINEDMTDLEKAYYLYQYLIHNVTYDYSYSKFTAYNALVEGSAVCQGYMLAYTFLLNCVDIPVMNIVSSAMAHGWNMINIDDEWFYVDCTWGHFLQTESSLREIQYAAGYQAYDWTISEGRDLTLGWDTNIPETGDVSEYKNYLFRKGAKQVYMGGDWYYIDWNIGNPMLCKDELDGTNKQEITKADVLCQDAFIDRVYYGVLDENTAKIYCIDKTQNSTLIKSYEDTSYISDISCYEGMLLISMSTGEWEKIEEKITLEKEVVDIMVTKPAVVTYQVGDEWDPTGMAVHLIYSDQTVEKLKDTKYDIKGFLSDSVGAISITVTYGEFEKSFDISVEAADAEMGIHAKRQGYVFNAMDESADILIELREGLTGTISYISSDQDVVTVTSYGTLVARKEGAAYVTLTCGDYQTTVYVLVHFVEDEEADEVTIMYEFDDKTRTAAVYDVRGAGTVVEIPSNVTVGGIEYTVTEAKRTTAEAYANIETLILPDTIKKIHEYTFGGSYGTPAKLKEVTLPKNCTIGESAFSYTAIESLVIPEGTTLDYGSFQGCKKLKSVYIEAAEISSDCFSGCSVLDTLTLGEQVRVIGVRAFMDCNLSRVIVPEGVTEIRDWAFGNNKNLSQFSVPSTVTKMGGSVCDNAKSGILVELYCTGIKSVASSMTYSMSDAKYIFYGDYTQEQIKMFGNISYEIMGENPFPDGPEEDNSLFDENVLYLRVGETHKILTRYYDMSELVFKNTDSNIASVNEEGVITALEYGTAYLEVFDAEDKYVGWITIYVYEFEFEKANVEMEIGETLTLPLRASNAHIGNFNHIIEYNIDGAQVVEICEKYSTNPIDTAAEIYGYITIYAKDLGQSTITMTDPRYGISTSCTITVTDKEIYFSDELFEYRKVANGEVEIVRPVKKVGAQADGIQKQNFWFEMVEEYSLTIPAKVIHRGEEYRVTGIADKAFYIATGEDIYCPILRIDFEEGIERIGNYAFQSCPITMVELPSTLKSIGMGAFKSANVWKNDGTGNMVSYFEEISIPSGCMDIGPSCFEDSSIARVEILSSIKILPAAIFRGCRALEHVSLPDSIRIIDTKAFIGCTALESINLPQNVKLMKEYVFSGCSALKYVKLPASLIDMGNGTQFQECTSLQSVVLLCVDIGYIGLNAGNHSKVFPSKDVKFYVSKANENQKVLNVFEIRDYKYIEDMTVNAVIIQGQSEMIIGESQVLNIVTEPETDVCQEFAEWKSSNEEIVLVANGYVKALKSGKATITATTITGISTSFEINVFAESIEVEIENTFGEGVVAITNLQKTLQDVELPANWSFDNPSASIVASESVQYFAGSYTQNGVKRKCQIPVVAVEITGAKIIGERVLEVGEQQWYNVVPEGIGAEYVNGYKVIWNNCTSDIVTAKVLENGMLEVSGETVGKQQLSAILQLAEEHKIAVTLAVDIIEPNDEENRSFDLSVYTTSDSRTVIADFMVDYEKYSLSYGILSKVEKTVALLRFDGYAKDCVIPATVVNPDDGETYTVVEITEYLSYNSAVRYIKTLTLPATVREIHVFAFEEFDLLETININGENPCYVVGTDGALYNRDKTYLHWIPISNHSTFEIPSSVVDFNPCAYLRKGGVSFAEGSRILVKTTRQERDGGIYTPDGKKMIVAPFQAWDGVTRIPYGVEEIGPLAFVYSGGYGKMIVPKTVYKIDEYAFANTDVNLQKEGYHRILEFEEGSCVTEIPKCAFFRSGFTEVILPESIQKIGTRAFFTQYIENFTLASLPNLQIVGCQAFREWLPKSFTLVIPESVRYIGDEAFGYAYYNYDSPFELYYQSSTAPEFAEKGLDEISYITHYVPMDAVGDYESALLAAGRDLEYEKVVGYEDEIYQTHFVTNGEYHFEVIPETQNVTIVEYNGGGENNKIVVLPEEVNYNGVSYKVTSLRLGDSNNYYIRSMCIPSGVKALDEKSFGYMSNLMQFTFAEDSELSIIGSKTFAGYSSLLKIALPDSVEQIAPDAFDYMTNTTVIIHPDVEGADALKDVTICYLGIDVFETDGIYWTKTENGAEIFYGNNVSDIPSVISDGTDNYTVTSIGSKSYAASTVDNLVIPAGVTMIKDNAFASSALSKISFEEGSNLITIGKGAFYKSTLENITLPEIVTDLRYGVFAQCSALKRVVFLGSVPTIEKGNYTLFQDCTALEKIFVSKEYLEVYKTALEGHYSNDELEFVALNKKVPLTGISVSARELTLHVGESAEITVGVEPKNTNDTQNVTWISSDNKIVSVKNGVIRALSLGTATVTAKVKEFEKTIQVTVAEIDKTGIDLSAPILAGEVTTDYFAHLTWNVVGGADGYALYRAESEDGTYVRLPVSLSLKRTGCTDETVGYGKTYYYKLVAYKRFSDGTYAYGESSNVIKLQMKAIKPVPSTGLEVIPSSVVLGVGETITLTTRLLPEDTTDTYKIMFAGPNDGVIEWNSYTGECKALKIGSTILTAGAYDKDGKLIHFTNCKIRVADKIVVPEDVKENLDTSVLLNAYTKLADVPIPEELQEFATKNGLVCSWKNPEIGLEKYLDSILLAECQWTPVDKELIGLVECEGVVVPISVAKISDVKITYWKNGIEVEALEVVLGQEDWIEAKMEPVIEGNITRRDFDISWNLYNAQNSKNNLEVAVTVDESGMYVYRFRADEATKEGTANLIADIVVFSYQPYKYLCTISLPVKVNVSSGPKGIDVTVQEGSVADMALGDVLKVQAEAFGLKSTEVTFNSGNSKVLKLQSKTGTDAVFSVVGYGVTSITMTAKSNKKIVEELVVAVRPKNPILNEKNATLDKNKLGGSIFNVCAGTAGMPTELMVASVSKGNVQYTNIFVIEKLENSYVLNWNPELTAEDYNGIKAGSYKVTIAGTINGVSELVEVGTLTVKVTETKPTITIKQTGKVNLFYTDIEENAFRTLYEDGYGKFVVSSNNATIANVTYSGIDFVVDENGMISFAESAIGKDAKKLQKAVTCTVQFEGYRESYTVSKKLNVATINQKPKLKVGFEDTVLYTGQGMVGTRLILTDATTKNELIPIDGVEITTTSKVYQVIQETDAFILKLIPDVNPKNETITFQVIKENWSTPVTVKAAMKVSVKVPKIAIKSKTVTLNAGKVSDVTLWDYEQAEQVLSIKNAENISVESVGVAAKNKVAKDNPNAVRVWYEDGILKATLQHADVKNGSYQYIVTPKVTGGIELAAFVYTVKVINKVPTIGVTAKGSIDLTQRDHTEIIYTPKLSNITGQIIKAELVGMDEMFFEIVSMDADGAVHVKALNAPMKTSAKYTIQLKYTLRTERGEVSILSKPVQIKPKQSSGKIVLATKQIEYSAQAVYEGKIIVDNVLTLQNPIGAKVETLALDADCDVFELTNVVISEDGKTVKFSVKIKEGALRKKLSVKAGKTYTLKLSIGLAGKSAESKLQNVDLKVKITP